jgi:hypothetical protein
VAVQHDIDLARSSRRRDVNQDEPHAIAFNPEFARPG